MTGSDDSTLTYRTYSGVQFSRVGVLSGVTVWCLASDFYAVVTPTPSSRPSSSMTETSRLTSACAFCTIENYGNQELCGHHTQLLDNWAAYNKAYCDYFHRKVPLPRAPDEDFKPEESIWG